MVMRIKYAGGEANEPVSESTEELSKLKVALCHDFLNQWGGAERVLTAFRGIFPNAQVFCTTFDSDAVGPRIDFEPKTSIIHRLPFGSRKYKMYFWLMPFAIEKFDFSSYDLVLTDSSNYIKGCKTKPPTVNVCYLHTPIRYLTFEPEYFRETAPKFLHPIMPSLLKFQKRKDQEAAQRPNWIIANSQTTAGRLREFYGREADDVVFPPVDTSRFYFKKDDAVEDYYLIVGRMVPYKRADFAISIANNNEIRLKVVGSGPEEGTLRQMAGPNVEFISDLNDEELRDVYARCKALVLPQVEDAGITPLEAMACGRPVIAFNRGGALESVVDGVSGIFFEEQPGASLTEVLRRFDGMSWNREVIRAHAMKFSKESFQQKVVDNIKRAMKKVRG